jgi:hypothetical protein
MKEKNKFLQWEKNDKKCDELLEKCYELEMLMDGMED